jgi:hypothetical protein
MNKQELGLFCKYAKSIERYDKRFLEELYQAIDKTEGWLWPNQAFILYAVASHLKGKLVEVGSWKGKSASVFCFATEPQDVQIYCVDIWENSEPYKDLDTSNLLNEFKNNLKEILYNNLKTIDKNDKYDINLFFIVLLDHFHTTSRRRREGKKLRVLADS